MQNNEFESSRIAEGTMRPGAQHIAPVPDLAVTGTSQEDTANRDIRLTGVPPESTKHEGNAAGTNKPRFRHVLGASTLTGDRVRNSAGDDLGKIEEIMLDIGSGQVAYAVLSFGGFLGIGDKLFMVPWKALRLDQAAREFVLDVPKKILENAPGFDKQNWPDMTNPDYGYEVDRHYGLLSTNVQK